MFVLSRWTMWTLYSVSTILVSNLVNSRLARRRLLTVYSGGIANNHLIARPHK
jgi:hypothetical protein